MIPDLSNVEEIKKLQKPNSVEQERWIKRAVRVIICDVHGKEFWLISELFFQKKHAFTRLCYCSTSIHITLLLNRKKKISIASYLLAVFNVSVSVFRNKKQSFTATHCFRESAFAKTTSTQNNCH